MTKKARILITVRVPEDVLDAVDEACAGMKISRSEGIVRALRLFPKVVSDNSELVYQPHRLNDACHGKK